MARLVLRLAVRNTRRRRARSALTAGMVVAAVALLMMGLCWVHGLFGEVLENASALGGHARVVAPEYADKEQLMPLWANLPEVTPLQALLSARPGVTEVEPRVIAGVTVSVGPEIGEVFALAVGASERYFRERLKAKEHLVRGEWPSFAGDELVLGATVAQESGAKVGDEVVLLGLTQDGSLSPIKGRLKGIVRTGTLVDRQVLVPLAKMQYLADIPSGATELLIFGKRYQEGPKLAKELRALPALQGLSVQSWDEREPLASMSKVGAAMELFIGLVVVLLAALGIWNTMTASVLERTHEIGVLRAMGLTRAGAVTLFVWEALTIAVMGGGLGVAVGLGPCLWLQRHGIRIGEATASRVSLPLSEVMHGELTWGIALGAFALGLAMALLGSVPAALRAASIQPVSAMRSGR